MSMQVNTKLHLIALSQFLDYLKDSIDLRVDDLGGIFPASVDIVPCDVTSEVSINDSIDIEHWKYVKIVIL